MKRALLMIAIPCGLAMLLSGIWLFHLGPFSIHPGDNLLLAHLSFTNGPEFFVIGHRNESAVEPYTINLYKVETDRRTSRYLMAFEDSYWWGCSIKSNTASGEIEIRAGGGVAARYLPGKDLLMSESLKVAQPAHSVHFGELQDLLKRSKR
ncbi:MAG TPA: hypothetical protein VLT36_23885 [Candidatus Dormibacteraeota bacterium]|nr:hypothetical protein [Candidatus Dormibacteraeota bacterium]